MCWEPGEVKERKGMKSFKYKTKTGEVVEITKEALGGFGEGVIVRFNKDMGKVMNRRFEDNAFADASTANRAIARFAKREGWQAVAA